MVRVWGEFWVIKDAKAITQYSSFFKSGLSFFNRKEPKEINRKERKDYSALLKLKLHVT
ncbi:MAG: hypothetical protein AB1567_05560 [bacterium]